MIYRTLLWCKHSDAAATVRGNAASSNATGFQRESKCGSGTSTRKPRLNSALVAQQAATLPGASGIPNGTSNKSSSSRISSRHKNKHKKYPARLKNVDRSTAQTREVTVNSVTVVITEYKPKPVGNRRESSEQSFSESNDSRS
ncbi:YY1-associated factor 2 isoform X2 [Hermetia illucens]|uniref:YY1-associated factor 2 isoform X2 n=1 Tax=Hermetia illucens TaxID=343691 RepID=UPI0018CC3757|nr:YY1-associated factor 2 isoform X2 [Hermetia illucens]